MRSDAFLERPRLRPTRAIRAAIRSIGVLTGRNYRATVPAGTRRDRSFEWVRSYDRRGVNVCDAASAGDGGFVLCGTERTSSGRPTPRITRTNSHGDELWSRRPIATDDLVIARGIAVTDGGVVVAGNAARADGENDALLVGLDDEGEKRWQRSIGGSGFEWCDCVVRTRDGGYALGGATESYATDGQNVWLVKTDGEGQTEWTETYGRSEGDAAHAVVRSSDGGYLLVGSTLEDGNGVWMVKTDSNGRTEWDRTLGGTGYDVARAAVETDDGGFAMAGHTSSFGAERHDAWLVTVDADGEEVWSETYGGDGRDVAHDLVRTADGGYGLVGGTTEPGGNERAIFVKTDGRGTREWTRSFKGCVARAGVCSDPERYALVGTASEQTPNDARGWVASITPPDR